MGHQGGSLEPSLGNAVYGATRMFGFGIGQDFLTHTVAPGIARKGLVCLVSRLKAEAKALKGEATWKAPRRGGQCSAPGTSKGEPCPLTLTGHMTLLCCGDPLG